MRLVATVLAIGMLMMAAVAPAMAGPRTDITIDPDQAAPKAKAGLLTEKDFAGNWLGITDIFADASLTDGLIPDTAACSNSLSMLAELGADIESERVARTNVALTDIDTKDSDGRTVTLL